MARATIATMIPLDRVAFYLQIDPYHFNCIETDMHEITTSCDDVWYQHDWQRNGQISRESLAQALKTAEEFTFNYLGWTPLPRWISEEEVKLPVHYRTEVGNWSLNSIDRLKSIRTRWGYIIEGGYKDLTLIDTPATVFTDEDGDGYAETVTVTCATTVTDEEELHVFFAGKNGRDEWEVRPLDSMSITAGVATITFQRYLIPSPNLWEESPYSGDPHTVIDGDDVANFETTVDVYRVWNNPSKQIEFLPVLTNCTGTTGTDTGKLTIRKTREGFFAYQRADWDATTETWSVGNFTYTPINGKIWYRAGYRDSSKEYPTRQMREDLERLIVNYALTKLDTELCGCSNTRNTWEKLNTDLAHSGDNGSYSLPWGDFSNPFGTTRAAFELWRFASAVKLSGSPYAN